MRAAPVPRQRVLEATRGAILARQSDGLPLLLEQLRSPDKALIGIGLRAARELPGRAVTEALAAELPRTAPERQAFLLLALADRTDAAVMPALLAAAGNGPLALRITAVRALDRLGDPASLPALVNAAAEGNVSLEQAALAALARLSGSGVDADLLARLSAATGQTRRVLLALAGQRHLDRALPLALASAEDPDAGIRAAAVQAIGILGSDAEVARLVQLMESTQRPTKEREDIETAMLAIISRTGARAVPHLLPLAQSGDRALRVIALHLLASAGGPEALAAVTRAVSDQDEAVQDEAVRTLSTWPNNWPEDGGVVAPLLALAKDSRKTSAQVLGLRGYLQYVQGAKTIKDEDKVSKVNEVLPLIKRPEEQRLAIGVVGAIPTTAALELLLTFAADPAVADDACSAILKLSADKAAGIPKEQRQRALQTVVAKSANAATKNKAEGILKQIQ